MQKTEELETLLDRDLGNYGNTEVVAVSNALHRVLQKVNLHRNRFAPINRLPPELLAEIFKSLITSYHDPPCLESPYAYFDRRDILAVLQVCQRWHDVAVHFPALWNHVNLDARECSPELIRRSDQMPLSFHLSINHPDLHSKLKLVGKLSERVKTLCISRGTESPLIHNHSLPDLWYLPQQLECLILSLAGRGIIGTVMAENILESIPKTQLKALAIESSNYDSTCLRTGPMPILTHLYLTMPHPNGDVAPMGYLLKFLLNAPCLEHLNLAYTSPLLPALPIEKTGPSVTLNHLRSITFTDFPLDFVSNLLDHLCIPPTTLLSMNDTWIDDPVIDAAWDPESLGPPPLALRQNLTFMVISIYDGYINWTAHNPETNAGFVLTGLDYQKWLPWAERAIALEHVQVLHLNFHDIFALRRMGYEFLPRFTHLKELFCMAIAGSTFVHEDMALLLLEHLVPTLAQIYPVICPELRVLGLETDVHCDVFPFDQLSNALALRSFANSPLSHFVYQLHEKIYDDDESHRRFSEKIDSLPVTTSEYLHLDEKKLCPFKLNWDTSELEKYWLLPTGLKNKKPMLRLPWEI